MKIINGKNYVSEHAIAVRANSNNSTEFLYYALQTLNLHSLSESSAQPGLSAKKLKNLKIFLPSLQEQRRIAQSFLAIDKKIDVQKEKLNCLRAIKQGLMQNMFI